MVRGNWQKRVERTEARRAANKLQKERRRSKRLSSNNEDKAQRATWYRLLSEWLDDTDFFPPEDDTGHESDEGGKDPYSLVVDIWTDARPKNRQEYLPNNNLSSHGFNSDDDFEEEEGRGSGKGKSKAKAKAKDRGGFKKTKGKKKAHPNTKQKTEDDDVVRTRRESRSNSMSVQDHDDKLCAKEFFFGKEKCPAGKLMRQKGGKRGNNDTSAGCSLQHYHQFPKVKSKMRQSPPLTLAQVVNGKYQPHPNSSSDNQHPVALPLKVRDASLKYAYDAMLGSDDNTEDSPASTNEAEANLGIESIYHTRIYVNNNVPTDQEDNEGDDKHSAVVDALEQLFDREKLSQTSLVYLTIQGVLVYDLNRGGLVFSETEEDFLVSGDDIDVDAFLQYNAVDTTIQSTEPSFVHEQLNHHILYDILSYLPDGAAAVLPQVCKSWRDEIGAKSPQLWKMLLNRHNWPFTSSLEADDDLDTYRRTFISHYVAVRDIRAIASASSHLCGESKSSTADKDGLEYAMQRYKSTKGAPIFNDEERFNAKVMVNVWSESVYADKVCARALAAYTHDSTLRLFDVVPRNNTLGTKCRQIACARAVQRRAGSYELFGMSLDEDVVACLFKSVDPLAFFLSIISRDDLASAGNEGHVDDDCFREFDIREMILDYVLCGATDHYDHLQTALHDYLSIGDGDTSFIDVKVTSSLVSCGQGYFLFLALVTIPGSHDNNDDDSDATVFNTYVQRAFLFSVKKGRIVKSVHFQHGHFPSYFDIYASIPFRNHIGSQRMLCTNVAVKNHNSATHLFIFSVHIFKNGTVEIQMKAVMERQQNEPGERMWRPMPVVVTGPMPVIVTSNCVISAEGYTCLAFMYSGENEESFDADIHRIEVGVPSEEICDIFGIREEYVVVVLGTRRGQGNDEEAVAGEWFGLNEEQAPGKEVVVFHISSRKVLFRCPFLNATQSFHCVGDTVAANLGKFGFVITGGNARDVARTALSDEGDTSQTPTKTPKAKKKRLASLASGRKKDGFARGMSMRG